MTRLEWALLCAATGAVIGLSIAPPAHADPYAGPHCNPTASDYDYRLCMDEPRNDPSCSPYGDADQCMSDWLDGQRQQQWWTSTPN